MNHYPLWKYLLIVIIISTCSLYALPNLFGEDPSVQISPAYARNMKITESLQERVEGILKDNALKPARIDRTSQHMLVRFRDNATQLQAFTILKESISEYVVAQNLAPATPDWLRALGGVPMYLGLDLRGGVHFLMQIDMKTAVENDEKALINDLRTLFREKKVRYKSNTQLTNGGVQFTFLDSLVFEEAKKLISKQQPDLVVTEKFEMDTYRLNLAFSEKTLKENRQKALEQNITTLRNRVNELGVAEPVIQRQGDERIVVQLPGVQDT
ncbi:MAG: protein translocase subunit SecD, partial [Proteobacteria bacterium]|nr:protein translocase subunit SecD [Pseudomonadota bacterium]